MTCISLPRLAKRRKLLFIKLVDLYRSIVEKCGSDLFSAIPPEDRAGLRWEHVGSTSIGEMISQLVFG